jgi:heat shock protein HslJ
MKTLFSLLFAALVCAACAGSPPASSGHTISSFYGKTWLLSRVTVNNKATSYSREELKELNMEDCFSLEFKADTEAKNVRFYGKAAPNRYTGSCTADGKGNLSMKPPAATLMAALKAPQGLSEHDYLAYLSRASSWLIKNDELLISSRNGQGEPVELAYIQK